jgi:hypothetical protein
MDGRNITIYKTDETPNLKKPAKSSGGQPAMPPHTGVSILYRADLKEHPKEPAGGKPESPPQMRN